MADMLPVLIAALNLSAPMILAAMGGLTSERSGVMNIALEGKMLTAAIVTALCAATFHNAWLGVGCGVVAAILMSLLHGLLTQGFRMDHIISGMAINLLAVGGARFLDQAFQGTTRGDEFPQTPLIWFTIAAYAAPLVVMIYLRQTRGGLWLLAVGNHPDKARQSGVEPVRVRYAALVATGVFCGLSGAMIVTNSGRFVDNMTAGRGFIALAALILGGWRPIPAFAACLVFGFFDALQFKLQGVPVAGILFPSEFWNALPYVMTLLALAGLGSRSKAPPGLGRA